MRTSCSATAQRAEGMPAHAKLHQRHPVRSALLACLPRCARCSLCSCACTTHRPCIATHCLSAGGRGGAALSVLGASQRQGGWRQERSRAAGAGPDTHWPVLGAAAGRQHDVQARCCTTAAAGRCSVACWFARGRQQPGPAGCVLHAPSCLPRVPLRLRACCRWERLQCCPGDSPATPQRWPASLRVHFTHTAAHVSCPVLQVGGASPADFIARLASAIQQAGQPAVSAAAAAAPDQPAPAEQQRQDAANSSISGAAVTASDSAAGAAGSPSATNGETVVAAGSSAVAGEVACGSQKQPPPYLRLLEGQEAWQPPATLGAQLAAVRSLAPATSAVQGVAAHGVDLSLAGSYAGMARCAVLWVSWTDGWRVLGCWNCVLELFGFACGRGWGLVWGWGAALGG